MGKLKVKFPLMTVQRHGKLMREQEQAHAQTVRSLYEQIEQAHTKADEVVRRLFRIEVRRYPEGRRYRLALDFNDDFIYRGFDHGNSQEMIRYLSERVGREVQRELATINFARVPMVGERRTRPITYPDLTATPEPRDG